MNIQLFNILNYSQLALYVKIFPLGNPTFLTHFQPKHNPIKTYANYQFTDSDINSLVHPTH